MKKQLLTLFLMLAASTASAQIVLWNGDDKETGTDGGFWNRADPTVIEDGSNKCLKATLKANPGGWDQEHHNIALPVGDADFKGLRRLTFRMKMEDKHNVMVQLEGKDGAYNVKRIFWYDTPGEWQTMVYEYSVGPDEDKITDTSNNVIAIWPYEETADGEGKTIYIDDIQLEGPMVNGAAIRTLSDDALSGNIAITGTLSKGKYQITWDGDWHKGDYDDYVLLNSKLSNGITSVDITGATVSDFDGDQFFYKNPNNIVYATSEYGYSHNIVADKTTTKLILDDAHPLAIPTEFTATSVELKRGLKNGINTLCLPFAVIPSEVQSTKIATFKGGVTFTTAESVEANIPFITVDATKVSKEQGMTFSNKTIATVTNAIVGTTFQGIYVPQTSTAGNYGINSAGKIQEGAADIKCNAFRAWLTTISASARSIDIDGETTGISNVSLENPVKEIYNLNGVRVDKIGQKGIYIINGKKVIVK